MMIFTGIQDYHNQNLYVRQVDFILMNSIQYPFLILVKLMGMMNIDSKFQPLSVSHWYKE